ncbi:hypothetical protein PDTK01_29970 [Phycicoccus sp. DTK01]|nr:hypothetical protein PDTK01_29970 [Phycicoccus sp. DTK01]
MTAGASGAAGVVVSRVSSSPRLITRFYVPRRPAPDGPPPAPSDLETDAPVADLRHPRNP